MASYRELYDSIENPLDNPETMMKLITAYAKSSQGLGGLYDKLTKTAVDTKQHTKGQFYQEDADRFYSMLFNKWKNSIVNMSKDRFMELRQQGSYGDDFRKLRDFLKGIPDITTKKEADEIIFGKFDDKELESAMDKYRWNAFGEMSGWVHVCSRYLTAKQDKYPKVAHRLYLDTESIDTYKMITALIEKFDEHQLPYYFKFDQFADRDDTIVIYSDNENLANYVEILQEIQKENPELVGRAKDPPALTGKIDGWIGYGSEPEKSSSGKNQSFNEVRAKVLETAIEKVTKQWIMTHKDMNIRHHGQQMTFEDYIAEKAADIELKKLGTPYRVKSKRETNEDVARRKGYTLSDLQSPQFRQKIYSTIRKNINTNLPVLCKGKPSDVKRTMLDIRNGKQISLDGYLLDTAIQEIAVEIAQHDKNFLIDVRKEIEKEAQKYGIDINKFCFDTKSRDSLFAIDISNEQQKAIDNLDTQDNRQSKEGKTTEEKAKSTIKENPSKVEKIGSIQIVDYLNPSLMKKMIQLPNGVKIPATQYIQEVVAPHIPASGKFMLKSGAEISARQFIEETILGSNNSQMEGNITELLENYTKANNGLINFRGEQINPVDIVGSLNPTLMSQKVRLPNGAEISARQYIQEVFAPYIPSSGNFMLKNGVELPASQFIEEVVLGQIGDYQGDVRALLEGTTKANNGTIDIETKKKTPRGQALQQEMGVQVTSIQEGQEETKENPNPIEEQGKISTSTIKKGLSASDVTIDETERKQQEIKDRNELRKLMFMGRNNLTEEQQKRLTQLQQIYQTNQQQVNYQKKDNGMNR